MKIESAVYKPFGEQSEWLSPSQSAPEAKGWIGERYDADAGLQYLNARYYDPVLGMFLQPDWFEVTMPGVGTNRYAYSFNDPINLSDGNGNAVDIFWDVGFMIFDVGKIGYGWWTEDDELYEEGVTDLVVDAASAAIPGLPAGGSRVVRSGTTAVAKVARKEFSAKTRNELVEKGLYGGRNSGESCITSLRQATILPRLVKFEICWKEPILKLMARAMV